MKDRIRIALAAAFGVLAVAASTGALAHDRGRHDGHRGHGWGHHKQVHHSHRNYVMVRERVVVHAPPPVIYERRAYYGSPAIVIGVNLPPLVIPLR